MLVHYHAFGDPAKVDDLVAKLSGHIRKQIDLREEDEVGRLNAEYQAIADKLVILESELATARDRRVAATKKAEIEKAESAITKLEKQREKLVNKLTERDERIADSRRRTEDDRADVNKVCKELRTLYADPDELLKHARVVKLDEIEDNEFNLNIPRYVDTFEPEPKITVVNALKSLSEAETVAAEAKKELSRLLKKVGYATD